jgi:hypothetical protein
LQRLSSPASGASSTYSARYKQNPPVLCGTGGERSAGRQLEIGEVIKVRDLRHGDEERSVNVVMVSPSATVTGFVGEPSRVIDNLNVYATDAE